jgi:hypothetical protein
MPNPTNPNDANKLTPDGLVNQLFDKVLMQNPAEPRQAARQVVDFLMASVLYALTSSKHDPVVFLTETLVNVVGAMSPDEGPRKEMLKYISEMLAAAAEGPPAAATQPQPAAGKP